MNLSDICRLCLTPLSSDSKDYFMMNESLKKKFKEITNTELIEATNAEENSRIPKKICKPCLLDFNKFHTYNRILIQKQEELREYLNLESSNDDDDDAQEVQEVQEVAKEEPEEPSTVEIHVQDTPVEEELQEASDEEMELNTSVKSEAKADENEVNEVYYDEELELEATSEKTKEKVAEPEAEIYYEEQNDDEQHDYEYVQEDAMTSDTEEYDPDSLYTEEVEEEEIGASPQYLETQDYHLKITGDEDAEYEAFDEVILMEEQTIPPKRKYERQSNDARKAYKCWVANCGAAFSNRQTMKKHMLQLHSILVNKATCMICGSNYDKYPDYLAHVKSHTRKFECDICKSTFVSLQVLAGHKKRFHSKKDQAERAFECKICAARFKRKEHVNSHYIYKHADNSARKFSCKNCPSKFLTQQDLKNHEKGHAQVMIHCNYCDNEYRDRKSIVRHCIKIHDTNKIYRCICNQGFEVFRDMQAHKKICPLIVPEPTEKSSWKDIKRNDS